MISTPTPLIDGGIESPYNLHIYKHKSINPNPDLYSANMIQNDSYSSTPFVSRWSASLYIYPYIRYSSITQ